MNITEDKTALLHLLRAIKSINGPSDAVATSILG